MARQKFERADGDDDPHRCMAGGRSGRCPFKAMRDEDTGEYLEYCPRHGGRVIGHRRKAKLNAYRLQVWQERVNEFAESEDAHSLKGEIGILRMTLETLLNQCEDANTLLIHSHRISDLAVKIEKLVNSTARLEKNMGMLLDKGAALALANQFVAVVSEHVQDPETIDKISSGLIDVLSTVKGGE